MRTLLLAVLLIATPAMAYENSPVQIINTGENSAIMTWVDGQGVPRSQPVMLDRSPGGTTILPPLGGSSLPDPPVSQAPLGNAEGFRFTE